MKKISHSLSVITFLLGCLGLVSVMALDKLYWRTGMIAEEWPNSSSEQLVRSIIIFISVLIIIRSFVGSSKPMFTLAESDITSCFRLCILGVPLVSILFLVLFIVEPLAFNYLSLEDGPVEWGSALLLFGSCIIVTISFLKSHYLLGISKITQLSLALLALVFFVMAMEEVSWFQRVLEIRTPKAFDGNIQGEMNLHNFATNHIENIYYFGAFVFLVVLPFIRFLFPYVSNNNYLRIFVARPFIAVIGSIACAYNFDMWNIIFTQIAFFGSVLILFTFAIYSRKTIERNIVLLTIILITITQVSFLTNGVNFARSWEVTV